MMAKIGKMARTFVVIVVVLLVAGAAFYVWQQQQRLDALAAHWSISNEQSADVVDHSIWQDLLDEYLLADSDSGVTLFAYGEVGSDDAALLNEYIAELAQLEIRAYAKAEQMAYWTNLYNALTVRLIVDHYPVASIRDLGERKLSVGPWDDPVVTIGTMSLTLNDIEHRILRPLWRDPRIHFAVNCASIGCPNLQADVFTGASMEQALDAAAYQYLNHPRGAELINGEWVLSSIFDWYRSDFASEDSKLLAALSNYVDEPKADAFRTYQGTIQYRYDWSLNDADL